MPIQQNYAAYNPIKLNLFFLIYFILLIQNNNNQTKCELFIINQRQHRKQHSKQELTLPSQFG